MSQSFRITTVAITSTFMMALAAGCGHTERFEDAFEKSKSLGPNMGVGGTNPTGSGGTATGGTNATGGTGGSTSGSGGMAPGDQCADAPTQELPDGSMKAYVPTAKILSETDSILGQMDLTAKISQMIGVDVNPANPDYLDIERSPDATLGGGTVIRGYNYRDAGHGVNLDAGQAKGAGNGQRASDGKDYSTVFPAVSARAASFDVDLERRVGEALGDETAATKNNMLLAPCMNIIRHPYWGRTQETYSEDTYHVGRMATAAAVGIQRYVVACAKHFAANNIERYRSRQDARMEDEQTLRESFLRHFEMVVRDGGVGCIMASYNMIDGVKSTQNKKLLTDILRSPPEQGGMGYRGLVLSDWWAMPGDQMQPTPSQAKADAVQAALAGLDVEVPWTLHYSVPTLTDAVNTGDLNPQVIDQHARYVVEQKVRFNSAYVDSPWGLETPTSTLNGASVATNTAHEDLAEEAEVKSAVLLQNGKNSEGKPVLPITGATKIAVAGLSQRFALQQTTPPKAHPDPTNTTPFNFATDAALGDRGSSRVNGDPARCIGPTAGIAAAAAGATVTPYTNSNPADPVAGATEIATAVGAADPDVVVVVVGYTPGDEGEEYAIPAGGDRTTINLPAGNNELVDAVLKLNKPTVIVIVSGSVVAMPWLSHTNQDQATVWAGYGGVRAGAALGKLLLGQKNFSGKMPMSWPADDTQIPNAFKDTDGEAITKEGYFFGYRAYDQLKAAGTPKALAFEFGRGLSYSTFTYGAGEVPCADVNVTSKAVVNITIDITNSAGPAGDEVAMLFIKPPAPPAGTTGHRPVKELKSFTRVSLMPGETKKAVLPLRIQDLRRWEGGPADQGGHWMIDPGAYKILVGPSGADADLKEIGTLNVQGG